MYLRILLAITVVSLASPAVAGKPGFALEDLDGVERQLSDYRGRWVIVNYWATWCPPCIDEMPELMAFHEAYQEAGVTVVGVNIEEIEAEDLRHFVDSLFVDYPILLAGSYPPEEMPPALGLPTTFVVSPDGDIVATELGQVSQAYLERTIRENGGELPTAAD